MKVDKNNIIGSVLDIRSSGIDITDDLNKPDGKTIAELLNDQETNENKKNNQNKSK